MVVLNRENLKNKAIWEAKEIDTYRFADQSMLEKTINHPQWIHFGPGNIFRAFIASLQQNLLDMGKVDTGIIAVAPYDGVVIEKVYLPHDCLSLLVTMSADGSMHKKVIGSIAEGLVCNKDWQRQQDIFINPSLQIASFTITEKGYKLHDLSGKYTKEIANDMMEGPAEPKSFQGRIAALAYRRYQAGYYPIAYVSMDNCSHNGDKIKEVLVAFAVEWEKNGLVEAGFIEYLQDENVVAFPCSMIDKITPRPSPKVEQHLNEIGFDTGDPVCTNRGSYHSVFVNAEQTQYLVIEDKFPNGRPPLEEVGVIFTDRATVDQVERMKVCTCLNPLHTSLAVFGCLLGYTSIADEMSNPLLRELAEKIGYREGLPVVIDPGVIKPAEFIKEVLEVRFPNPNIPDTPQRIASDTSQKIGIRFGETIRAYMNSPQRTVDDLVYIPLTIAGWLRYLLGIDDKGNVFELSPDPLLKELRESLAGIQLGRVNSADGKLSGILATKAIFGISLIEAGLGDRIEGYFKEMISGNKAVENTLKKYVKLGR